MVQQRDELGLSLSLSFPGSFNHNHKLTNNNNQTAHVSSPLELNDLVPSATPNLVPENNTQKSHSGPKMETCREDRRYSLTGIDLNGLPTADMGDEADRVLSPNSTPSSLCGNKRSLIREGANGENVTEFSIDQEDGDNSRKKLRLSIDQTAILEASFREHNTLSHNQKTALAKRLGLKHRQVEVWFQNRRARTKLKQTEIDYEFLKTYFRALTEENAKLKKEVQELRTFKLSPQVSIPPTTLTICPSCEHLSEPSSAPTFSVCPSSTRSETPQVHAMSTTTIASISTCAPNVD
ncbi:homeobox-leucine zipper protein HAT4 [Daucus carota subsp. sativus]|uniref:Homeobox domain-containing protein n=2 Tax=Daucus carota subsp. sativus TaxID=79200 RepID=A0A166CPE4_DAUCS|nr:PREDICTED: homeobox-leucine zipper protein HAT4-like [Daucus carota subsp. sativus]